MKSYADIPGWFDFAWLYDNVVDLSPRGAKIVEVGCWLGRSLAYLAARANERGRDDLTIIGVDHGVGSGEHAELMKKFSGNTIPSLMGNLAACGLKVPIIAADSVVAADLFDDRSLAFVFLDASHEQDRLEADIDAWLPKIVPGGMIAGHDYNGDWPGVVRAVDGRFGVDASARSGCWMVDV